VTGVKKVLVLLIVEVVLLGAAFGGGLYLEMQKRKAVEKQLAEVKKKATTDIESTTKTLAGSRARTQVLEAALGVVYQNYGMAFDRIVRTKALAGHMGLSQTVDGEIDDLMTLLTQQKPEAVSKLLTLADKLEPTPMLTLPKGLPPMAEPRPAVAGPGPTPAPGGKPGTPIPVAPPLAKSPPPADAATERDFIEGRDALRQAKEALIAGGETSEVVKKLARAQVLLNESGYAEVDDEIGTAIKAAKSHDETKVRTSLEAALARLRAR
jgi:hypothetical protein